MYNDSVFSLRDFHSLQNLGNSSKREEKLATGKFGLGFISVISFLILFVAKIRYTDGLTAHLYFQEDIS